MGRDTCQGGSSDYEGYRHIVSTSANRLARTLLGIRLHEFTTSFRAFRTDVLAELDLGTIRSQGYSFFMESLWHIARAGHRVKEVPIHFADRVHGESKIPRWEIFTGGRKLLSLFLLRLLGRRPRTDSVGNPGPCPACESNLRLVLYPETVCASNRRRTRGLSLHEYRTPFPTSGREMSRLRAGNRGRE